MKLENIKNETLKAYILIGLPGSGKSTWLNTLNNLNEYQIISTDNYIQEIANQKGLTYNDVFNDTIKDATRNMDVQLKEGINNNLIWDQTNLTPKKRKGILNKIPDNYEKIGVVFEVNDQELMKRINKRAKEEGKNIPKHVINNMKKSFVYPSIEEGFDKIIKGN